LLVVFLGTLLENSDCCIADLQMNVPISIYKKGLVGALIMGLMVVTVSYAATSFFLFFAPNFGARAYAQEDNNSNNSTLILEDMRAILRDQQRDMASIRNTSSTELELIQNMLSEQIEVLKDLNVTSTKLSIQGAYTALSVFFLGIGLVIFGLRLTSKVAPQIGRSMTIMVWALTIPVIVLIGLFQYGEISGTTLINLTEEPYFLLSFLLYIPIAIIVYLILKQKGIVQDQEAHISKPILEMEKLARLKERGMITEEEFQKLKAELLAKS
jgi:Short C-terminal domain